MSSSSSKSSSARIARAMSIASRRVSFEMFLLMPVPDSVVDDGASVPLCCWSCCCWRDSDDAIEGSPVLLMSLTPLLVPALEEARDEQLLVEKVMTGVWGVVGNWFTEVEGRGCFRFGAMLDLL